MSESEITAYSHNRNLQPFVEAGPEVLAHVLASNCAAYVLEKYHTETYDTDESFNDWVYTHFRIGFITTTTIVELSLGESPLPLEESLAMYDEILSAPRVDGIATDEGLGVQPVNVRVTKLEF